MRIGIFLLVTALVACTPDIDQETEIGSARPIIPTLDELTGRWRIISIDGETLPTADSEPYLAFSADAAGGSVGCNRFGSLTLYAEGRIAAHSWGGDAMGCIGPLATWETAIAELFRAYPRVRLSDDKLSLRSGDHEIELSRAEIAEPSDRSPDPMRIPVADPVSQELASTKWTIRALDGEGAGFSAKDRRLSFDVDTWQGRASCATPPMKMGRWGWEYKSLWRIYTVEDAEEAAINLKQQFESFALDWLGRDWDLASILQLLESEEKSPILIQAANGSHLWLDAEMPWSKIRQAHIEMVKNALSHR